MDTTTTLLLHIAPLAVTLALAGACSREAVAGEDDTSPSAAASPRAEGKGAASIRVEVSGLRNTDGVMRAYLYASAEGFPVGFAKAFAHTESATLTGAGATLEFTGLEPGEYAVFVFHDEDDDGELDKNLLGLPKEGIGGSNLKLDKPKRPKWSDAKFEVRGPTTQRISLRYI